jgi:hypothetical protein
MMRVGLVAPLYLSVSWVLTVSYQLFTETAVNAIALSLGSVWPSAGAWLTTHVETLVFVYAFTWIFVLSSVLPSVILGRERSILIQYAVVLTLTLIAFFMPDILFAISGIQIQQLFNAAMFLNNPLLAGLYLAVPYLVMIFLDWRSRKARKKKEALTRAAETKREISKAAQIESAGETPVPEVEPWKQLEPDEADNVPE